MDDVEAPESHLPKLERSIAQLSTPSTPNDPFSGQEGDTHSSFLRCIESLRQHYDYLHRHQPEVNIPDEADSNNALFTNKRDNYLHEFSNQFDRLQLWGASIDLKRIDSLSTRGTSRRTRNLISAIFEELEKVAKITTTSNFETTIEEIDEKITQLNRIAPLLSDSEDSDDYFEEDILDQRGGFVQNQGSQVVSRHNSIEDEKYEEPELKAHSQSALKHKEIAKNQETMLLEPFRASSSPAIHFGNQFFVGVAFALKIPCLSLSVREQLMNAAIKKRRDQRDWMDDNLLFPPSVIHRTLVRETIEKVLRCKCSICNVVTGMDLVADYTLIDEITVGTQEADKQLQLFATLVFMGAGFAVRHICSFCTRGWDLAQVYQAIQSLPLEPLELSGITSYILPTARLSETSSIFLTIFKKTWKLFSSPTIIAGSYMIDLSGSNLPFLGEQLLSRERSSLFSFEIHPEFRGENIPKRITRKEVLFDNTAIEERRTLEFLGSCRNSILCPLLFSYRYGNYINYVFPLYPGSLQEILDGKLQDLDQIRFVSPGENFGSKLNHWLWQGIVEIVTGLMFVHSASHKIIHGNLKPSKILVDDQGTLLITDFGRPPSRALAKGATSLTANATDAAYQPPPMPEMGLSRSWDVWSIACIMIEVIVFITSGTEGFRSFYDRRLQEGDKSASFWSLGERGGYKLKGGVQKTLDGFRAFEDQYLNIVTDLLRKMFAVNPLERVSMRDCVSILSADILPSDWPLQDDGELRISGIGTSPQLRNMHTRFKRKLHEDPRRCNMYLLFNTNNRRKRLTLQFEREINDASKTSKAVYELSDSVRLSDEKFIPLSLFDATYMPVQGPPSLCSFRVIHPSLTFIFDDKYRGPQEYYHFLTAATRQRSLQPQVHMPIFKCTVRLPTIRGKKESWMGGHMQIWRELSEREYYEQFTNISTPIKVGEEHPSVARRRNSIFSRVSRASSSSMGFGGAPSSSRPSSTGSNLNPPQVDPHRVMVFLPSLPGSPARCLTINLDATRIQKRTHNGKTSALHVTLASTSGKFRIGNFTGDKSCPGIPLDPQVLAESENFSVDWVEIVFRDAKAMTNFQNLWRHIFPPNYTNRSVA